MFAEAEQDFTVDALGQSSQDITLATPAEPGKYVLKLRAFWDGKPWSPTLSPVQRSPCKAPP